jgi:HlyD family secretion protein
MATKVSKSIWIVLLAGAAAVLVFVAAAGPGRDRPVRISITHVTRQELSSWTTGNGKVEPIEPHVVQAQLSTRIAAVYVKEGQTVKVGAPMLLLDATEAKSELARVRDQLIGAQEDHKTALQGGPPDELAQIQSDLAKTNREIVQLTRDRETLRRLLESQAATRVEVDQNRIALEKAELERDLLEQKKNVITARSKSQAERSALRADEARESIQSLEQKINSARVLAPVGGAIYALTARSGTFVRTGDTLAEMADLRRARVRAFIDEPELGSLKQGQTVEITWDALPARVWMGMIEQLPTTISTRGSRNVGEVLCSVNNDTAELLPNTNVNIRIRIADRENVLTLPRAAVRTDGGKRYVFVVEDNKLRTREVTVGISNPTTYQILSGITEQDAIAIQADTELREGQTVAGPEQK